jgi:hypothetical protein
MSAPSSSVCVIGGVPDGRHPCETIHEGLLELWRINEGAGSVASGVRGLAALNLTPYGVLDVDGAWNGLEEDDDARGFFGGVGEAIFEAEDVFFKNVGEAITIVQRRWLTGMEWCNTPVPPQFTAMGQGRYAWLDIQKQGGELALVRVVGQPSLAGSVLTPGPLYLERNGGALEAIAGTAFPAPSVWPPPGTIAPYLCVITATMVAVDRVSISVMGKWGTSQFTPACVETDADYGQVGDPPPPPPPPPPPLEDGVTIRPNRRPGVVSDTGTPITLLAGGLSGATIFFAQGGLDTVRIGGIRQGGSGGYLDTIHQAAMWRRALTIDEVAWLGDNLDSVFASYETPGSACVVSSCTTASGLGTAHPLLATSTGTSAVSALTPSETRRGDVFGLLASASQSLRETRAPHGKKKRVYTLVWDQATSEQVERVRQAWEVTKRGCVPTAWKSPDDEPGDVCTCAQWLMRAAENGQGLSVERNSGGVAARLVVVLEEV